jgi:ferredoxin--NADP+ reductase
MWEIPAQLVVRSVGYRGVGIPGVPFDEGRGVVPSSSGRVVAGEHTVAGLYVAGWIKRGPTGIIGTNKKDAAETVGALLADVLAGVLTTAPVDTDVVRLLADRGTPVVEFSGWRAIDAAERALGATRGRDRTTIHDRDGLLRAAGPPR